MIGGGLLGLEAANALRQLGLETHVVEFAANLMAVQLDNAGAAMLREKIEALGVGVHTAKSTTEIESTTDGLVLHFADGEKLETEMVVFSAGIRPQDALARRSGLDIGERGGICIDSHCRTSDDAIFAIGECALWEGRVFGLVAPGYQMARVVAAQLAGEDVSFSGADMSTKLKLLGVDVASFGDAHAPYAGREKLSMDAWSRADLQKDRRQCRGQNAVGRSAGWRCWRLRHAIANDVEWDAASWSAGIADPARAGGRCAKSAWGCGIARYSANLLLS